MTTGDPLIDVVAAVYQIVRQAARRANDEAPGGDPGAGEREAAGALVERIVPRRDPTGEVWR
jgi:hypothetical protein